MELEQVTFLNVQIGMQVLYVPRHVLEVYKGYPEQMVEHRDCERGFVTSYGGNTAFCRYYYSGGGLRTVANSESTPYDLLFVLPKEMMHPQDDIDSFIKANYHYNKLI